ncbi:MAG: isoprenylcysteine carboxylmethyltransferase family protein [Candidatus Omnitrophica bacterium]|nr:isoprenylcysteine carboxylmethyltransferase family protein [Candidatus Omnitrophota bacterium]
MSETKMQKRFKRWFKPRFAIFYPLGWWILFTRYSTDQSLLYSLGFLLAGVLIRTWANGYAIKMDRLTTCGPYGHVRHPLYVGSFLLLVGMMIMLKIHWLIVALILTVIVGWIYRSTIRHEERMLKDKFGAPYLDYIKKVSAFWPRLTSYQGSEQWPWSFQRYYKSQEYKIVIWMSILIIIFYLKGEFLLEKEALDIKHVILISIAIALALLDLISEYYRKQNKFSVG